MAHPNRLEPSRAGLLVIDVQERLLSAMPESSRQRRLGRLEALIAGAKALELPEQIGALLDAQIEAVAGYDAADPDGRLGQISTEFIPNLDYGEGCRYSLFEQGIACVEWMRSEWEQARSQGTVTRP